MTATDLTLTHRLAQRYLRVHHPSVTIDPYPSCALHPGWSIPIVLRSQCRRHVEMGHDKEGWWARVEPGGIYCPSLACSSLSVALTHAVNYLEEFESTP